MNWKKYYTLLKWTVSGLITGVLLYQLFSRPIRWSSLWELMEAPKTWMTLGFVLALMPVNLLLESEKWRRIFPYTMTRRNAMKAVFGGMSIGVLTPNKVGEYGGRVWFIPGKTRQAGIASTMIGNWGQLFVTLVLGAASLTYIGFSPARIPFPKVYLQWTFLVIPLVSIAYFYSSRMLSVFTHFSWAKRLEPFFQTFSDTSSSMWWKAIGWSILRYLVFACQLALVVSVLSNQPIAHFIWVVPAYYFVQSVVPTIALTELGVRGYLLSLLLFPAGMEEEAFLAGSVVWLINLIVPACIGLFFILRKKANDVG